MRVVIDTNVLVSGVINPHGPPGRVLDAALARNIVVLHDDRILTEYREVLSRPLFGFERADIDTLMEFFDFAGEHVSVNQIGIILPDASDLPFLEVAVAGRADALITGNLRHFKPISGSHDVNVCTPAEFLERRN